MESKIMIDIKDDGDPLIYIDCKASDDLRDKVLSRFFTRAGAYSLEPNPIKLIMHVLWYSQEQGRIQAMIETIQPVKEQMI